MVKAHVFTHELVAGRYRLVDVVHRETNRVCWYGTDGKDRGEGGADPRRPFLLTEIMLPLDPGGEADPRVAARALRMSDTMGDVCPGRVASVVDAVAQDGSLWIVTEWIDGTPLSELLAREGPFEHARAAGIALEVLNVLTAAHGQGITHGELSPGQVYVRDDDTVLVTGFGLAGSTLAPRLTAPSYASPEQARDQRIGPAADLWALGAILYTMLEGRPPYRERERPGTTLKGVDRLPLRAPVRSGSLGRTVQGLLRKDCRERLTRTVVREALLRALAEDPAAGADPVAESGERGAAGWGRRAMVGGTVLATATVVVAVLAATQGLPGTDDSPAKAATTRPSAPASRDDSAEGASGTSGAGGRAPAPSAPASPAPSPSPSRSASPSASPSASGNGLPAGFRAYSSPEGFSVALPEGWKPIDTTRSGDLASRVTFGAPGDPRTLAVTYSEVVGADPVAVWRDDVEPDLERFEGFRRIGEIEATTFQGRKAADMEWVAVVDGERIRTLGRGFLIGGGRGFSLRWTTPAADWDDKANKQALATFFRTFRVSSG